MIEIGWGFLFAFLYLILTVVSDFIALKLIHRKDMKKFLTFTVPVFVLWDRS